MQVIEALTRCGVSIGTDATLVDAANLMEERRVGSLVVVDGDVPVGLVTDRDLVRRATARRLDPAARVDGVMSAPPVTIDAGADLGEALRLFETHAIRHLVVTRDRQFVGVVTWNDIVDDLAASPRSPLRPRTALLPSKNRTASASASARSH